MINLITGYNNTGKTTWLCYDMNKKHNDTTLFANIQYLADYRWFQKNFWKYFLFGDEESKTYYLKELKQNNWSHKVLYFNQPENGLHPSLQSKLVKEFIKLDNEGYDLYIETHSDHIINATRVAIKQGLIKPEDVKVLFFKAIDDFVEIKINEKGKWRKTPIGFCNEYDKQLSLLFL